MPLRFRLAPSHCRPLGVPTIFPTTSHSTAALLLRHGCLPTCSNTKFTLAFYLATILLPNPIHDLAPKFFIPQARRRVVSSQIRLRQRAATALGDSPPILQLNLHFLLATQLVPVLLPHHTFTFPSSFLAQHHPPSLSTQLLRRPLSMTWLSLFPLPFLRRPTAVRRHIRLAPPSPPSSLLWLHSTLA